MFPPADDNQFLLEHVQLLTQSFERLLGYPLLTAQPNSLAKTLFHAPFILISHNNAIDPVFNYANQQGLNLFQLNWQQLIRMPSRLSAESLHQSAREKILAQVSTTGFMKNYSGIRISSQGQRFQINQGIIWNVHNSQGDYQGQAAYFSQWHFLD